MPSSRVPAVSRFLVLATLLVALVWLSLPAAPAGPALEWQSDVEPALERARLNGQPAILSFHATWCSICRDLDERSLRDPVVARALERFVRVRVDAGGRDPDTLELMRRLDVRGLPALVLYEANGELSPSRVEGYLSPARLSQVLAEL